MPSSMSALAVLGMGFVAVASASADISPLVPRQSTACSQLHLMVAGGCSLPCSVDTPGLLASTISDITGAFPGVDQYFVPYDDSEYQGAVSTPLMIQAAEDYAQACPNTPIVFLGYSLGGIIVMNSICGGISTDLVPNVLATIVYGEETQTWPQPYDVGTCTNSAPKFARANPAACEPFAPSIQSYCDEYDPQCCNANSLDFNAHFEYPAAYDTKVVAFIASRLAAIGGNFTLPSSASVPPATATYPYSGIYTGTGSGGSPYTSSVPYGNTTASAPISTGIVGVTSTTTLLVPVTYSTTEPAIPVPTSFASSAIPVSGVAETSTPSSSFNGISTVIVSVGLTKTLTRGSTNTASLGYLPSGSGGFGPSSSTAPFTGASPAPVRGHSLFALVGAAFVALMALAL